MSTIDFEQENRIAGLPNSDSNRASDMFMKTRYLCDRTGGRGVVFATGTPISNTMAEMYTHAALSRAGAARGTPRRLNSCSMPAYYATAIPMIVPPYGP